MNITKPIAALLTSAIVFTSTSTLIATGNEVYTDHGTYIDPVTFKEYDKATNQEVASSHSSVCPFVLSLIESSKPSVPDVPEEQVTEEKVVVEETKEPEESVKEDVQASLPEEEIESETKDKVEKEEKAEVKKEEIIEEKKEIPYTADTWYHPSKINPEGYTGKIQKAILRENFVTCNWDVFKESANPFALGQCTYFAWSRFYQVYGFDSGARGNGKTNAAEIVKAHGDKFILSSTPSAGAVYSIEKNTKYPEYGHVGFIEAFDGEYIWISEGNVEINGSEGNIWLHKVKWEDFKNAFPDATFAVPKELSSLTKRILQMDSPKLEIKIKKIQLKRLP